MRLVATRKAEQNAAVLDPWTVVHFSTGLALGLVRFPFAHSITAAVVYEALEQVIERHEQGQELFDTKRPEIPLNAVVDVIAFLAGHRLGSIWNDT